MLSVAAPLPELVQQRWQVQLPEAVAALCWRDSAGDRHGLLSACADGWVRSHGIADGGEHRARQAHEGGITVLSLRPPIKGRPDSAATASFASAGEDGRVRLWDARFEPLATLAEESNWVEQLAWTPDGRILAAAAGRSIELWRDGESLGVWYDASRTVLALAWAPDSKRLATAANKGLHLWQVGGEAPVRLLQFPGAPVVLGWRRDGKALAVGTQDGFLQVWRQTAASGARRTRAGSSQLTMRGYPAKVNCLQWHPTRSRVATAGGQDVVVWDIPAAGGGKPTPFRLHRTAVTVLGYSPDGTLLASGDRDGRLCVWRDSGALVQCISVGAEISALAWGAEGTAVACGTTDGQISVWDIEASARASATTQAATRR